MSATDTTPTLSVEVTADNVEAVLQSTGCHGPNYGLLSKAGEFDENFSDKGKASCGVETSSDFPMDDVISRLDGIALDLPDDTQQPESELSAAKLMRLLLEWIVNIKAKDNRGLSPIATRTLACVWVVNPELVGNCAGRMVAKSYGISYQKFSIHAAEFSRTFKIQNRFQLHDGHNARRAIL